MGLPLAAAQRALLLVAFFLGIGALGAVAIDGSQLDACPPPKEVQCERSAKHRRAALYLVGVKERLILEPTMEHVVRQWVHDGFAVDVYASLIMDAGETGATVAARARGRTDPQIAGKNRSELQQHLRKVVEAAGGCLMCAELPERPEHPEVPELKSQVTNSPPHESPGGKRLMNLWYRRERMWNASLQAEAFHKRKYDFLMWAPDSSFWVKDIVRPSQLLQAADASSSYWMRPCGLTRMQHWNDHVIGMGRQAAGTLLTLFSQYSRGGLSEATASCEEHLNTAAMLADLTPMQAEFEDFPQVDAMFYGEDNDVSICLFHHYACDQKLENWGFPKMKQCEHVPRREKHPQQER